MTYEQALDVLLNLPRGRSEFSRLQALLEKMDNPHKKLKYIHVGGTNGKGTTCTMLSYILEQAGYKVGLNISPHVTDFRERIQINNRLISKQDTVELLNQVMLPYKELEQQGIRLNYFEVVFAMSVQYFVEQQCDIVVLEVGLGGRNDSTNIIEKSLLTIFSNISLDHTSLLGNTVTEIAHEKVDIIKPNGITISYAKQHPDVLAEIMKACQQKQNELIIPHNVEILEMGLSGSKIVYDQQEYLIPFLGEHQIYNTLTVLEAAKTLKRLGYDISYEDTYSGIKKSFFPSRLEVLSKKPLVLMDGAHNISGASALTESLNLLEGRKVHAVIGMLKEKDVQGVVEVLSPSLKSATVTAELNNSMFVAPRELAELLKHYLSYVRFNEDPMQAFLETLDRAQPEDVILICGSFYLNGAIRNEVIDYLGSDIDES